MSRSDISASTVSPARVQWDDNGQPISSAYDDVYFSRQSGLEETRYVFLQHNQLEQRFSDLTDGDHFTIAETGFGTGLNFLTAWQLWQQQAPAHARLHFVSVEKHPLSKADLTQALALWPELTDLASPLIERFPPPCPGFYRLQLSDQVSLTLLYADAIDAFQSLKASVDAWFLDGFAPAKNPDMWTQALFEQMARLSKSGTTFSTFTAAGMVRRGLQKAGFHVNKVKGFAHKREMICGQLQSAAQNHWPEPGWSRWPCNDKPQEAIVLGAGIAGCSSARALAERGVIVQVIDRHPVPANEASGNPQGVLYAKLPAKPTPASRIHLNGLHYSLQLLQSLDDQHWQACGVLQLGLNPAEQEKQDKLCQLQHYPRELVHPLTAEQASAVAGVNIQAPALSYPGSGWVSPKAWCQQLLDHPNITLVTDTQINHIEQTSQGWQLSNVTHTFTTATLVLACADQARQFSPCQWLPTKTIRGQVSQVKKTVQAPALKKVLCGHSYISPATQDHWCFGATFNLRDENTEVRLQDHQENLCNTQQLSEELAASLALTPIEQWQGRVAFRCTSPDYLPIVGPVPVLEAFTAQFAELRHDAKAQITQQPEYYPGLYVNIAHGSKGMITAPLAAELLASQLCNEPLPIEQHLAQVLLPARFLVKKLIKRAI